MFRRKVSRIDNIYITIFSNTSNDFDINSVIKLYNLRDKTYWLSIKIENYLKSVRISQNQLNRFC